jgi:glucose 1-dehydrogenase
MGSLFCAGPMAARGGVGSLTFSSALELAEARINVNNVAPCLIQKPTTQEALDNPKKAENSIASVPWHRPRQPKEIARMVLFLASDYGDYVTERTWVMDGGPVMN